MQLILIILPFFPLCSSVFLIFFFNKEHTFHIYTKKWETKILKLNNKSTGQCCQDCASVQTRATTSEAKSMRGHQRAHKGQVGQSMLPGEGKWTWLWALTQLFPSHGPWWAIYRGLSLWSTDRLSFDQSQQDREDHSLLLENWDLACSPRPS